MSGLAQVLINDAVYDTSVDIARWMILNMPCAAKKIAEGTHLNEQTVLELTAELGVILPDDPDTL